MSITALDPYPVGYKWPFTSVKSRPSVSGFELSILVLISF